MQLIRAINKSNKSNNNNNNNGSANQTSSNNNTTNKVVIVAPPTNIHQNQQQQHHHSGATSSSSLQVSRNANKNSAVQQPVSPSASLPPLKKRTIVKQAVPPPPPPRKSSPAPPRSSKSNLNPYCTSRIIVDVDRLQCLSEMEIQSGNLKVKQWLKSVELLPTTASLFDDDELSIRDEVTFKGVRKLIESFSTIKEEDRVDNDDDDDKVVKFNNVKRSKRKISDSSLVKTRVEGYNILENKARNQSNALKSETDSGIEISSKSNYLLKFHHQFSRDGEFV